MRLQVVLGHCDGFGDWSVEWKPTSLIIVIRPPTTEPGRPGLLKRVTRDYHPVSIHGDKHLERLASEGRVLVVMLSESCNDVGILEHSDKFLRSKQFPEHVLRQLNDNESHLFSLAVPVSLPLQQDTVTLDVPDSFLDNFQVE